MKKKSIIIIIFSISISIFFLLNNFNKTFSKKIDFNKKIKITNSETSEAFDFKNQKFNSSFENLNNIYKPKNITFSDIEKKIQNMTEYDLSELLKYSEAKLSELQNSNSIYNNEQMKTEFIYFSRIKTVITKQIILNNLKKIGA